MDRVTLGLICGAVYGVLAAGIMVPMKLGNHRQKTEAILAALVERFMIGFLIPTSSVSLNPIVFGALIGLGLSLPSALITRAWGPIVGFGVAGGIIIGVITYFVL